MTTLDRSRFRQRLEANAVGPDAVTVTLPNSGDTLRIRQPNKEMVSRSFAAAGDDDDQNFLGMINLLRWMMVDDDDNDLARGYGEARSYFMSLDDNDAGVLMEAVSEQIAGLASDDDDEGGDDAEDPKGS